MNAIKLRLNYKLHWLNVFIDREKIVVSFEEGLTKKVNIGVIDRIYEFKQGDRKEFPFVNPSDKFTQNKSEHNENSYSHIKSGAR